MAITVWTSPTTEAGMQDVVETLDHLGYRARLAVYTKQSPGYFSFLADSRNRFQAAFGGWVGGVPNASDFLAGQFVCSQFLPANPLNVNLDEFCDPAIDRLVQRAERAGASEPAAANRLWAQVDRQLVGAVPWIGLVTPSWVDVVSSRVHNYVRSSVLGVFFDQMWVR
jgi:peptide/nickel transport system substrate-binding protein